MEQLCFCPSSRHAFEHIRERYISGGMRKCSRSADQPGEGLRKDACTPCVGRTMFDEVL